MINLLVIYTFKQNGFEPFVELVKNNRIAELSREEDGAVRYDYFTVDDCNKLYLLESWRDEAARKKHGESEHFKLLQSIKAQYIKSVELKVLQPFEL